MYEEEIKNVNDVENQNSEEQTDTVYQTEGPVLEDFKYPGFLAAVLCSIVAACLLGFNFSLIYGEGKYYPKLFGIGFVFLGFAIGFLVSPGERIMKLPFGLSFKEKLNCAFKTGNSLDNAIHFLFAALCFVIAVVIIIKEDFYLCLPYTLIVVCIGSITLFFKTIVLWIMDSGKSLEEKEDLKNDETKFNSPAYRIFSICISVLITILCMNYINEQKYLIASSFGVKKYAYTEKLHHSKVFDKYLKDYLDKDVPYRLCENENGKDIDFIIDVDELTNGVTAGDNSEELYVSALRAPLSKLISYVLSGEGQKTLIFSSEKDYSEYNKNSFENNSYVKKYFENNPVDLEAAFDEYSNFCSMLSYFKNAEQSDIDTLIQNDTAVFLEAKNIACVINYPKMNDEFIYIWDLPHFTEYYNSAYNTDYEPEDLISDYDECLSTLDIGITKLGTFLYYAYRESEYTSGLILNYGTADSETYSALRVDKIISNLTQNEEYNSMIEEYLKAKEESDNSDSEESAGL